MYKDLYPPLSKNFVEIPIDVNPKLKAGLVHVNVQAVPSVRIQKRLYLCTLILIINAVALISISISVKKNQYLNFFIDSVLCRYDEIIGLLLFAGFLSLLTSFLSHLLENKASRFYYVSFLFVMAMSFTALVMSSRIAADYQRLMEFQYPMETNKCANLPKTSLPISARQEMPPPVLMDGPFRNALNYSMKSKMVTDGYKTVMFSTNLYSLTVWAYTQQNLQCCGVDGPEDWLDTELLRLDLTALKGPQGGFKYPGSCYSPCNGILTKSVAPNQFVYKNGCLNQVAFNLYLQISLLLTTGLVSLVLNFAVFVAYNYYYFRILF